LTINEYKHPILFYFLCISIPWSLWFAAAYLSHLPADNNFYAMLSGVLGIIGLISPALIAFLMMYVNPKLRNDLWNRLFTFKKIQPIYLFLTCFLMLGSILVAQAISLIFGYSVGQFAFSGGISFSYALFPAWIMLFLAPCIEELAWHSYGTDCLRARFSLFSASMIFAVFWAFWHFPLSFIKDYYHSNLAQMGFFNEIFATHPDSKVIQTVLLLCLTIALLYKEPEFFFSKKISDDA
jgi:membrane protease YdiL (CAAX protease family)